MRNIKHEMLYAANKLRNDLSFIEDILEDYNGIEGNTNYVKYCYKKSKEAHDVDNDLNDMLESTYAIDSSLHKGINIAILVKIIEKLFKLLDDIDTASDMFKPNWCDITQIVNGVQKLRWRYCTVKNERNENDDIIINGEKFNRVVLSFIE
jgi:hypothetical protein